MAAVADLLAAAFDVKAYLPDSLAPQYDSLKNSVSSLFGIASSSSGDATGGARFPFPTIPFSPF